MKRLYNYLLSLFGRRPKLGVAFRQGDPPPPGLGFSIVYEGGAAKAPVVLKDGGTRLGLSAQLAASRGVEHKEHCWLWLTPEQLAHYDPADLKTRLGRWRAFGDHIYKMAGLPRKRPEWVDLINEPLAPGNSGPSLKAFPPELLPVGETADPLTPGELSAYFGKAKTLWPGTKFGLNEWGCEVNRRRGQRLLDLIDEMTVKPDYVGLECHLSALDHDLSDLDWLCAELRKRRIPVCFTELDIDRAGRPDAEVLQVEVAEELMQIARRRRVEHILLWHWRDRGHWKPGAAPFDEQGRPKEWARTLGVQA